MPRTERPLPYAESILPMLDSFRKVLHVPSSNANIDLMPARGTTLSAAADSPLSLDTQGCSEIEKAYIFSHAEATRAISENLIALYFVQSRTGNTAYTPVLTHGGSGDYSWPDEVRKLDFTSDPNIPLTVSAVSGGNRGVALLPRWFLELRRNPGPGGKWTCRVNHYLSSDPFPPNAMMRYASPDAGEIPWDLAGHSDRLTALHGGVTVPIQSGNYATNVGGTTGYLGGEQEYRRIPRTAMSHWSEFTLDDDQQFTDGLWHRIEIIIEPPPRRKPIPRSIQI